MGLYELGFTYLLTPWSRVLLEKLASLQLVKKFPAFYGLYFLLMRLKMGTVRVLLVGAFRIRFQQNLCKDVSDTRKRPGKRQCQPGFTMVSYSWNMEMHKFSRLTTGWTDRDRIPVGTRFSARPDRPWGPPSLL